MSSQHEGLTSRFQELIPELGVGEDDMVTDIMILAKSVNVQGQVSMHLAHTMREDWVLRQGFLRAALDIEASHPRAVEEE